MRPFVILCALCPLGVASAADLASRIVVAQDAAITAQGAIYERAIEPSVGTAIRVCVPPGSSAAGNLGDFTMVADVAKDGSVQRVQVDPETRVSRCFADRFATAKLPTPPDVADVPTEGTLGSGYPIQVQMRLVQ